MATRSLERRWPFIYLRGVATHCPGGDGHLSQLILDMGTNLKRDGYPNICEEIVVPFSRRRWTPTCLGEGGNLPQFIFKEMSSNLKRRGPPTYLRADDPPPI